MLLEADLVLCMTANHAGKRFGGIQDTTPQNFTLSQMTDRRFDIVDPYGKPLSAYERMARIGSSHRWWLDQDHCIG